MPFAQARVGNDLMPGKLGDRRRRLHRATEIAAVERRESFAREPLRQGLRLKHALFRQSAVEVALPNALDIPFRLAVTDDDDLGAIHEFKLAGRAKSHGSREKSQPNSR